MHFLWGGMTLPQAEPSRPVKSAALKSVRNHFLNTFPAQESYFALYFYLPLVSMNIPTSENALISHLQILESIVPLPLSSM